MYKVTLSMPVYNVAPYVERALLSALNQTFDSIEFLIVDDRGTDNSMDIVRKIVAEHPRGKDVRIIEHPHNIGTGATKNTAIDNAKGEYLFFMDSDDEITPDCIEVLYKAMMKEPVDFVAGSYDKVDLDGKLIKGGCYYKDILLKGKYIIPESVYSRKIMISGITWNKLYSIAFLKKNNIRCIPHHINEDGIFTPFVFYYASSCTLLSNITLTYYQRENSTEYNRFRNFSLRNAKEYTEMVDAWKEILSFYVNTPIYGTYLAFIVGSISRTYLLLYQSNSISKDEKTSYYKNWTKFDISLWKMFQMIPFDFKGYICILIMKFPVFVRSFLIYRSIFSKKR